MTLDIEKLEDNIKAIGLNPNKETFIFDFLLAFNLPKASIARLKKGDQNLSKTSDEVLWKKKLYFKAEYKLDLHETIDRAKRDLSINRHHPRLIIVTDFSELLAIDTKTSDSLDIPIKDLGKHYGFFLPLAGMEKAQFIVENPADVKAAEKMGRLYDTILEENEFETFDQKHSLNVFVSRLLFCFFAEDTNIFESGQFTSTLASFTAEDGSDLQKYFQRLFKVLNTEKRSSDLPAHLSKFPYVNGGLFAQEVTIPKFSSKARKIIIECGSLNWAAINPDIFGSMIQAVVHSGQRGNLGMHYTSVANIMKVIGPLFLDELYSELEAAGESKKKLTDLLNRLYRIKIFDPACGSGNFLIIAYKELCKLEIEILKRLHKGQRAFRFDENIKLSQFYGIEIDDFAHETAKLSLWLAEHQMNLVFEQVFTAVRPTLPLQDGGNIVCGNATRINWENVCENRGAEELYIIGNPPYLGSRHQEAVHKQDIAHVCSELTQFKKLDYVTCWFLKASKFIQGTNASFAFVSTNSICQGEQVELVWPFIFEKGLEIVFAHQSFKWRNNAKSNAGVTCVIVGISNQREPKKKYIFSDETVRESKAINAYLTSGSSIIVRKRSKPLSDLPKMESGNKATDGGHLILSQAERKALLATNPEVTTLLRRIYGAEEFLNSKERWCIWIEDNDLKKATEIPEIHKRILKVREVRLNSQDEGAHLLAERPHQFREMKQPKNLSLIFPTVSSERRSYIPIGYLKSQDIVIAPNQVVYDPPAHLFAIISSRMHMCWVRTVGGRLKTDYRYSSALCYNTFPFPKISAAQQSKLEECVYRVLDEREQHSERTLAELYDPDKMPKGLLDAHREMDLAVEQCYRKQPFSSDEERLEHLFALYEKMIAEEKKGA